MPTSAAETCMHGTPNGEPCDPCKVMDLFKSKPKQPAIDLGPALASIVNEAGALEGRMRALAKQLTFAGHSPPSPIADLNTAATQVKCARLFLQDCLASITDKSNG